MAAHTTDFQNLRRVFKMVPRIHDGFPVKRFFSGQMITRMVYEAFRSGNHSGATIVTPYFI